MLADGGSSEEIRYKSNLSASLVNGKREIPMKSHAWKGKGAAELEQQRKREQEMVKQLELQKKQEEEDKLQKEVDRKAREMAEHLKV